MLFLEYTALYLDDSCDTTCHKQLTVDNKGTGSIFSQRSAKFESGVNKKVTITAPPGYIIHLDFEKLSFNLFGCSNYVQLFDGEDDSASKALTSQRCQGLFFRYILFLSLLDGRITFYDRFFNLHKPSNLHIQI